MIHIERANFDDPRIAALVATHVMTARSQTGPQSAHALDLSALQATDVMLWTICDGEDLIGMGALKEISPDHGEVKSMHTILTKRRAGAGRLMLQHIIRNARTRGMKRLSLETGAWEYFYPAHKLYRSYGFVECGPFADYIFDPNSLYMSLDLTQ
jgi:putative acetyltransferase